MADDYKYKNGPPDRYEIDLPETTTVAFDQNALQDLLRTHGIKFVHYKGMRCPIGLTDKFDSRISHTDHSGCSNGLIYKKAGIITGYFSTNKHETKLMDLGLLDDSSAIVSVPNFYDDNPQKEVYLAKYDRLYMTNFEAKVPNWQIIEHNQSGNDRLQFPAVEVEEDIIDANGSVYKEGKDFNIDQFGAVQWIPGGNSPGYDIQLGNGIVYSIRYLYKPFWYISSLLKEIRVSKSEDYASGDTHIQRQPYQILIQREYVFKASEQDPESQLPTNLRQGETPNSGSFRPK